MLARVSTHSLVFALLAAVIAVDARAEPAADPPSLEQRVERYLQPYRDIGHFSGTLLIARGDQVVYEKSFGLADREHGVPNTPRTRFGVGSVNKPMTIVVLARLVEMEKLALDDRLFEYLPDFPRAAEITVGDLLRHSAGIPHRVTEPLDETRPQTPTSMVELAAKKDLVFEPGSDSVYSSAGFSVLTRVLELAGGKPYAELLAEHVLRPAGMADTSDAGTRAILENRAESYYFDSDGFVNAPPSDISYLVGAGSVFSTPQDLLAMQQALLAGGLGKGAQELLVRDNGNLSWNGLANGYRAFADYDAASGVSVVVASNLTSGALDKIRSALPEIAAGEDVPTPEPIKAEAADVDTGILEGYQGAYELRPGRNLELRVVDGRVMMEEWLLIPTSERTLFSPQDYAEIEVVLAEEGGVSRLDWTTGGQTYPLPRVSSLPSGGPDAPSFGQEFPEQKVHRETFSPASDEVYSFLEQFFDFDVSLPLQARIVEEWDDDGARFEKVVFSTNTGERVPGELALPSQGSPPFPAVLLVHGLGSSKERWWREDRQALPKTLLANGIAVFAIDLRFHGERSASNDYQSPVFLTMGNDLFVRSRNMGIQSTIDSRRALQYLSGRADIDSKRMAVVGYSMGGMIALRLTALEEGLAAVVACAVPTTEQPQPSDHFHFAARAKAPTLLLIGRDDWLSSPTDAEILLGLLPVAERKLTFYDSGHKLPPEFAVDAADWLRAKLQPRRVQIIGRALMRPRDGCLQRSESDPVQRLETDPVGCK